MKKLLCLFACVAMAASHLAWAGSGGEISKETSRFENVQISLLTCSPGTEIYALFGHTAIRYEEPARGLDLTFNYGMFDFNAPNFVWRFVKGETDYQLGVSEFSRFEMEYYMRGSYVVQQTLNLKPEEKERLWSILSTNYQPANRVYRYNYFYDNCTTRARDRIEDAIIGKVVYPEKGSEIRFRQIIHQYTQGNEWSEFGIDFLIGGAADKPIDMRLSMFAPFYLSDAFDKAIIEDHSVNRPLISDTRRVVSDEVERDVFSPWFTPLQVFWGLFLLILIVSILELRRGRRLWGIDVALFALAGVSGSIIAFLVFFSVHPAVSPNYLLCLFHPLHLLYLPYLIYCGVKGKKDWYQWVNLVVLTLFIMLWPLIPQSFNPAILPLAFCLLTRSLCRLVLQSKR